MMKAIYIKTFVAITYILMFQGCVLIKNPNVNINPVEENGVTIVHAYTLGDVKKYQKEHTLLTQVKSHVLLNDKNIRMRAKKVDADSVVVYSTNELLKEVYGYYFFKKSKGKRRFTWTLSYA